MGGFGSFPVALFVTPMLLVLLLTGWSRRVEWYFAKTLSAVAVEAAVLRIRWGVGALRGVSEPITLVSLLIFPDPTTSSSSGLLKNSERVSR
jgi:hypothetical protein